MRSEVTGSDVIGREEEAGPEEEEREDEDHVTWKKIM